MKREEFLKTMVLFGGSLTVVGCSKDLLGDFADSPKQQNISIDEAQKWFNESYIGKFSNSRSGANEKGYKRKAAWERAKQLKNNNNKEYVWIPMDYEDSGRPGVLVYDEGTKYRLTMTKNFLQPVLEGLIVVNDNGKKKACLAQIAYDPFALAANNYQIEKSKFSGTLIRADWDDTLIDGSVYGAGKIIRSFKNPDMDKSKPVKGAKVTDCYAYYLSYNTWSILPNGEINITVHSSWETHCDNSGGGFGGGGGGGGYGGSGGGGGSGDYGNYPGGGGYYDPLVNSGAGSGYYYPSNTLFNFNQRNAVRAPGPDRAVMVQNMHPILQATGLATSITGWSWDKADTLVKAIGGNIDEFFPVVNILGKSVGAIGLTLSGAGLAIDGYQLYLGISEDGFTWNEDGWNAAQLGLGITGLVLATAFAAPWVAVVTGTVSIGIAIYKWNP